LPRLEGNASAGALTVAADPFFSSRREKIIALTARHELPTMYALRPLAVAGGLISYSASLTDSYRQVGVQSSTSDGRCVTDSRDNPDQPLGRFLAGHRVRAMIRADSPACQRAGKAQKST
jgi:hypothetical protein